MAETTDRDLEARLVRLEAIVDALEGDELELEAALALFEEGVGHLRGARDILKQTELRVEKLLAEVDEDVEGRADEA
ncbi:MAG: exodeoxyribonuclease VII small subunit [Gemmatimonadota bacterium]|jgi:exodeoxyribonuclease VII small subunit